MYPQAVDSKMAQHSDMPIYFAASKPAAHMDCAGVLQGLYVSLSCVRRAMCDFRKPITCAMLSAQV